MILTVQGDATEVVQEVVGEEPIQDEQQFEQHLHQPCRRKDKTF